MSDFLIQHLAEKAKEHSSLALLLNQWGFDEKLIPKALQNVGNLFPHYSRHDESHSKQILVNIERLLGDNIAQLTATDTWLLLEAAYWHDIGMVVPQKDLIAALTDPAFAQYLDQLRNTPHHDLHRFAQHFNSHDVNGYFSGADSPMEAMDKFRQLMAEWFRRSHAARANQTIQTPWDSAGISSPRTELIPARLFKLLGKVCQLHGHPFSELLSGLHYREAGMAQEDCHPRFVACLLRLGDLLDLDDNRFCPVMQRIAGDQRPTITRAHEDKHASIRHLRMDRERIEISAECATIDGYLETFKWFDWLKQEMQDQMSCWQDIVPSRIFASLPTLGEFKVSMCGELQILKQGQRPQFSVDGPKAIELLQGNNLYNSKFACIRELLQNAVDATLLRYWLTEEKKHSSDIWESPFTAKEVLANAKVVVNLKELAPEANQSAEDSFWCLSITDEGTGISREDLSYMLRIGGSQSNLSRQIQINRMPEWMKPSGAFGIGFQSVFLICDSVKLVTKSIFTNETLEITMYDPSGEKEGLVLFQPLPNDISQAYGTRIELICKLPRSGGVFDWSKKTSHSSLFFAHRDPIVTDRFVLGALNLADSIEEFAQCSLARITGELTAINAEEPILLNPSLQDRTNDAGNLKFIEANNQKFTFQYFLEGSVATNISSLYRGQAFDNKLRGFPGVNIVIDIMSGKAGEWLTASRDKLKSDAVDLFHKTVLAGLEKAVREDIKIVKTGTDESEKKMYYSLFLDAMNLEYDAPWDGFANEMENAWVNMKAPNLSTSYSAILEGDELKIGVVFSATKHLSARPLCDLLVEGNKLPSLAMILNAWQKKAGHTMQVIETNGDGLSACVQLKTTDQEPYSLGALAQYLMGKNDKSMFVAARYLLDCNDTWRKLYLKPATRIGARPLFNIHTKNQKFVLLPFYFEPADSNLGKATITVVSEKIDALCKWVQPNLVEKLHLSEIRSEYLRMIEYIDYEIMKKSRYWEEWQTARGIEDKLPDKA